MLTAICDQKSWVDLRHPVADGAVEIKDASEHQRRDGQAGSEKNRIKQPGRASAGARTPLTVVSSVLAFVRWARRGERSLSHLSHSMKQGDTARKAEPR